ncbi:HNH endonuclease signature motif containing protein [uncultured Erythrobacter sp.]|uniref:HNH endonuclease n=1 Tax=uncultured Erythrobacter sp. TaxID=263913 RepID=UPI00265A35BD|nr:HNH endonuclease signature motif containing protein [uncultured Erythrobacter sp.]
MKKWLALDAFEHLGAHSGDRYAWSAQSADGSVTVVTLWEDEIDDDGRFVRADFFDHPKLEVWVKQKRNATRKRHLQHVWEGDRQFRVVMLRADDVDASPRSAAMRWPEDHLTMTLLEYDPQTGAFRAEGTRTGLGGPDADRGWTEAELSACVRAYRELWLAQQAGIKMNKSALRRKVVEVHLSARGAGAYEFRMQNISAVMEELGLPIVQGYLPRKNVGAPKATIIELINREWDREGALEAPTADPEKLETRVLSALQRLSNAEPPPPGSKSVTKVAGSSSQFVRDPNVIAWTLKAANGVCEACDQLAPFKKEGGVSYLEVHHMRPLFQGGPDTTDNTIAACPNCHRRLHHAGDRDTYRRTVIASVVRLVDHPKRKLDM